MTRLGVTAALLATTATMASAGGIDRSGQSIAPLFQEGGASGSYVQLSFGSVDPTANSAVLADPLERYNQTALAFKTDLSDSLSAALIVDRPFGADVAYTTAPVAGLGASVSTDAVTGLVRYKLGNGFSVHGGVRMMRASGSIVTTAVLNASSNWDAGYVVGAAYEIPDIALRVALTYNSGIRSRFTGTENGAPVTFNVDFPESVNLDFQTGIAANTLLTGSVRYAGWNGFNLTTSTPTQFVNFTGDTYTYSLGLGRRITDSFAMSASIGYEAPGNTPSSTALAPTTGLTSLTVGASYTMDNLEISGGVTVGRPGDQSIVLAGPTIVPFNNNTVVGAGIRIGMNF